jgi:DNA-binding beta-propeller fold protein YncE
VFVAHTANDTIEVLDGERLELVQTITGCPEGSGVLCTREEPALVFLAARGNGKVLVLDPLTGALRTVLTVGPKPNGLAWDPGRNRLLVADVEDFRARVLDARTGTTVGSATLPGRPRWCVFDAPRDRFLINIREPACVVGLSAESGSLVAEVAVSAAGPHGLDLDQDTERAYVACDDGRLAVLDLAGDREVASLPIGGQPDAIWFNSTRRLLYVAIGVPGVIDVVDCQQLVVAERVETEVGAHTTAFDSERQRLYVFQPGTSQAAIYQQTG